MFVATTSGSAITRYCPYGCILRRQNRQRGRSAPYRSRKPSELKVVLKQISERRVNHLGAVDTLEGTRTKRSS